VDEAVAESVRERVLSCFPEGTFAWVDVLGYGDDPAVEPGDTAVRVFIDQAGRPEEDRDRKRVIQMNGSAGVVLAIAALAIRQRRNQ
jgi:hypothetical protein